MKEKKMTRKLSLNKETITNLNAGELKGVKGGTVETGSGCSVCYECDSEVLCWHVTYGETCIMTTD
jgi:hypothetical protein